MGVADGYTKRPVRYYLEWAGDEVHWVSTIPVSEGVLAGLVGTETLAKVAEDCLALLHARMIASLNAAMIQRAASLLHEIGGHVRPTSGDEYSPGEAVFRMLDSISSGGLEPRFREVRAILDTELGQSQGFTAGLLETLRMLDRHEAEQREVSDESPTPSPPRKDEPRSAERGSTGHE